MFPYLFWCFPLIAFNKFTNPGESRRLVDYLIIASAVFVFAVSQLKRPMRPSTIPMPMHIVT
jgi:hypothetical protein